MTLRYSNILEATENTKGNQPMGSQPKFSRPENLDQVGTKEIFDRFVCKIQAAPQKLINVIWSALDAVIRIQSSSKMETTHGGFASYLSLYFGPARKAWPSLQTLFSLMPLCLHICSTPQHRVYFPVLRNSHSQNNIKILPDHDSEPFVSRFSILHSHIECPFHESQAIIPLSSLYNF